CGCIHVPRRPGEAASLLADAAKFAADGIVVERLTPSQLAACEPHLAASTAAPFSAALRLPDEAQIRNPRHLQALVAACRLHKVELIEHAPVQDLVIERDRVTAAQAPQRRFSADKFCLAAGAWSEPLCGQLGVSLGIYPVRGQMVLYRSDAPLLTHVVNEGPRYLVPRSDGRLLAGSTEEDVGFDKRNTDEQIAELRQFAESLLPPLAKAEVEATWAGLRPHGVDGFPHIGRVPHLPNCYIAAGHYRSGLYTSPGTAVLLRQLMVGESPSIDMTHFRLSR
ncbi:MAG: FAD-dependent oxidoreductase, partial [Planctomycetales bacterium]|nr:FAD-dependent oxidoreductase [Planctomycetales bacterium]